MFRIFMNSPSLYAAWVMFSSSYIQVCFGEPELEGEPGKDVGPQRFNHKVYIISRLSGVLQAADNLALS